VSTSDFAPYLQLHEAVQTQRPVESPFLKNTEVSLTLTADVAGNSDMGATHVTVNLICVTTARQPVAAIGLYPCWEPQHDSEDPLGIVPFKFFLIMGFTIRLRKPIAQTGQVAYAWTELN